MASLLCGVASDDPAIFDGMAIALGVIVVLISVVPVRRAALLDPLLTLRCD